MRLAIGLFLLPFLVHGQEPKLAYAKGFTGNAWGIAITTDEQGNTYTVGRFSGNCDFDPGPGTAILQNASSVSNDLFVAKLDPNGEFIWVKHINSDGYCPSSVASSVQVADDGSIFVAGYIDCPFDFDEGSGLFTLQPGSFIAKYSAAGTIDWVKGIGGGQYQAGPDMVLINDAVVVVGSFTGSFDFDPGPGVHTMTGSRDAFILKLDLNGVFINAWEFDNNGSPFSWGVRPHSVTTNSAGDIIVGGLFGDIIDFDPSPSVNEISSNGNADGFLCRLSNEGDFIWANSMGGVGFDQVHDVALDEEGMIYITGDFESSVDMDPGPGTSPLVSLGGSDIWVASYTNGGQLSWSGSAGGTLVETAYSLDLDTYGNIWVVGLFAGLADFDLGSGTYYLTSGGTSGFIAKWDKHGHIAWAGAYVGTAQGVQARAPSGIIITGSGGGPGADMDPSQEEFYFPDGGGAFVMALRDSRIGGSAWHDWTNDCQESFTEPRLAGRIVEIQPIGYLAQTNSGGIWSIDSLPPGAYTAKIDNNRGPWMTDCAIEHAFEVLPQSPVTAVEPFGLVTTEPCTMPDISIVAPMLRRCFSNLPINVSACNQLAATGILSSGYIVLTIDPVLEISGANFTYTALPNNRFQVNVGDLYPGECFYGTMYSTISCSAMLGQTLCLSAELFPVEPCALDTIPGIGDCATAWDGSNIKVDSYCLDDTVHFTIRNTALVGVGDMSCYSEVRIYLDGVRIEVDSVQLAGGETFTFAFPGNGQTWRLEADQHPLHPGNSQPIAVQERCGLPANWTPRLVATQYMDDADPVIDIYCGFVTGSFDPNDKVGYPTGLTDDHFILPGQQLQYMIRFQNTGNDTAFTVIIRDTLDISLNAFTLVPGVASHPYSFRMYGPRVIEWKFENILLPDSTTNSAGSNGFVTFRVDQVRDLPNWTVLRNVAAIYFDFNEAILTEPSIHTVHDMSDFTTAVDRATREQDGIRVYPNPTHDGRFLCEFPMGDDGGVTIYDTHGRSILQKKVMAHQRSVAFDLSTEPTGIYFIEYSTAASRSTNRVVKY
ncbi:MAG TPA: T9SS type A sorting domain-containing protein [Flavobacteriales bacterium]|nr:T9SS type A sorting domain-containing protein [Flavobacteriales bacterium]HQW40268.1 T9SS type A sorting domain-containing protein [Flavobacteriales bacterium]